MNKHLLSNVSFLDVKAVFPKLCAADEAEVCRESFMFWQNLLYVASLPSESLWRVGFYEVGVPRPNPVFIIVCRNEIKFEKRCVKGYLNLADSIHFKKCILVTVG